MLFVLVRSLRLCRFLHLAEATTKVFPDRGRPTAHELLMFVLDASSNLLAIPRRWYAAPAQHPTASLHLNVANPAFNTPPPASFLSFYDVLFRFCI